MAVEALAQRPRPSEGSRQRRVLGDIPRTFTPEFEMKRAAAVEKSSSESRENFLSYELMQMETHLGERFNVNISRFDYEIKDRELYGKDMDEPFLESIVRGRDLRLKIGNPVDFERENAEVEGFIKTQKLLTDPETPSGTIILSISPKGRENSTYQHNFYDIFTVKEKNGKRYVETRRYTSGLGIEDYKDKLSVFADLDFDGEEEAAYFLANPIAIQNTLTPDDLHRYLHQDHKFMDERTFGVIKKHCAEIAKAFAVSLIDEPENFQKHKELFDTYLNKADNIAEKIERDGLYVWDKNIPTKTPYMVREDVNRYGRAPVREVMTGCGASGSFETTSKEDFPFSVADFGSFDKFGKLAFKCPECKETNIRPYGEMISHCQNPKCKSDKVAC